ncbi:MAG: hypothetical protein ACREV5_22185 [Steroidobacter sp.]
MKRRQSTYAAILSALAIACSGCAQVQTSGVLRSSTASNQNEAVAEASPPPLEHMKVAQVNGKITVPVEVRYQFASEPLRNQPTTLDLAFVPRVGGENLKIELPKSKSVIVQAAGAPLMQQKADAKQTIRRKVLVTALTEASSEVRVLVSMDVEGGRYFGVFTIPIGR